MKRSGGKVRDGREEKWRGGKGKQGNFPKRVKWKKCQKPGEDLEVARFLEEFAEKILFNP